jgi:hypothetical protein
MPRYFFHISDGRRTYPDPLGIALPSLEAAKAHARQDAQALSESWMALSQADWRLMVADESGAELLSIALSQAARPEAQPGFGHSEMLTAA